MSKWYLSIEAARAISTLGTQAEDWYSAVVDSVSGPEGMWVRSTGFDEAWTDFLDRPHV